MNSCQSFHFPISQFKFYILQTNRSHGKWKWPDNWHIWLTRSIQQMRWDICWIFFSDFRCIFFALGGVCDKSSKSKYHSIHHNKFFDTPFVCHKHPLQVFCFFPLLAYQFCYSFSFPIFWGVKKASCQIFHVLDENWPRNNFPKLTTLWLLLHANVTNFPTVHCCHFCPLSTCAKKWVHLGNKILHTNCKNNQNIKNSVPKNLFCCKSMFKCVYLRFDQWLNNVNIGG